MKKKYWIWGIFLFFLSLGICNAASLSVSANKSTVVVGNTVKVTVKATGAAGWEYCISYDSSKLTLSSSTVGSNGNTECVLTGSTLTGGSDVTFTFKAKKSGSTSVTVKSAGMYNDNGDSISFSKGSVSLNLKTQSEIEASYSTDATLKSLSVEDYDITPEFNKNTLEYSLEVENDVEDITIHFATSDDAATVSGAGKKELSEGINKFEIVVTAEKGNKKTYVLNVTRKELNPINVTSDGVEYTVVRKSDLLTAPTYYEESTTVIDGEEVPCFTNDVLGNTLVGLKDSEGNIALYVYDNDTYNLYVQFSLNSIVLAISKASELISGYETEENVTIQDNDVVAYGNENSEFLLIYGTNVETGKSGWYSYDPLEGTIQRYIEVKEEEESNKDDIFLFALFGGGLFLAILIVLILFGMLSSKDKKIKKLINFIESKKVKDDDNSLNEVKEEEMKETEEINDTTEELNNKFLELIDKEGEREREINIAKELSKKELKKESKRKKKKEQEELKDMRDDFLDDGSSKKKKRKTTKKTDKE